MFLGIGVMNSVHSRRDDHPKHEILERFPEPEIGMVEHYREQQECLPHNQRLWINANQENLCNPVWHRERNLPEMKAESSGSIEVKVDVVDSVESPQQRNPMVQNMLKVEGVIQECQSCQCLDNSWQSTLLQ